MNHRDIIIKLVKNKLKKKFGVEVGVWKGETTEKLLSKFGKLKMLCVDPYVVYSHYKKHHNLEVYSDQRMMDGLYVITKDELVKKFKNRVWFIRDYSTRAAFAVEDGSADFVFLDANYGHDYVKDDIAAWYPKLRKGGVIIGQNIDSNKDGPLCVKRAVEEVFGKNYKTMGRRWYHVK